MGQPPKAINVTVRLEECAFHVVGLIHFFLLSSFGTAQKCHQSTALGYHQSIGSNLKYEPAEFPSLFCTHVIPLGMKGTVSHCQPQDIQTEAASSDVSCIFGNMVSINHFVDIICNHKMNVELYRYEVAKLYYAGQY